MENCYEQEKEIGIEAIIKASSLCRLVQKELVHFKEGALEKEDRSPVTVADYGAQAIICRALKTAFPGDAIVAEESARLLLLPENRPLLDLTTRYVERTLGEKVDKQQIGEWIDFGTGVTGDRFWTLDPIDGTKGFLRGDQYAVALALIINKRLQIGLLACPNLPFNLPFDCNDKESDMGSLYIGVAKEGAYMMSYDRKQSLPLQVSSNVTSGQARFIESYESNHSNQQAHQEIIRKLGNTAPSLRMDSQAKYGMLARGAADIYLRLPSAKTPDYYEKIWDHAAGTLMVEEAGGIVTDIHGQGLDFGLGKKLEANQGIVASNGNIHKIIIETIRTLKRS